MKRTTSAENKTLVLAAFDTLFNKRDYVAAERYWSPNYFSGHGQSRNWISADIVRIVNGVLVEHWDVIEDEASRAESKSGLPMFGADFSE